MRVLGIESTCDETACAIVEDGRTILGHVVASQMDLHAVYGGVVPELASRRHLEVIIPIIEETLKCASLTLADIDLIAVAKGPGLIGALLVGLNIAKGLAWGTGKPLVGVNHVEAHLYAALMSHEKEVQFPCLGVVVSGGHTSLILMKDLGQYQVIGETVDDAIGEAFDKVARLLDLPYPGGPHIEALAASGNRERYAFKAGLVKGQPFHFSFSGLKTKVLYTLRGQNASQKISSLSESERQDLCAAFQEAALGDVVSKTVLAAEQYGCSTIVFGGGVSNNKRLRTLCAERGEGRQFLWPADGLSLDNAAMIAGLGYHQFRHHQDDLSLLPQTRIQM